MRTLTDTVKLINDLAQTSSKNDKRELLVKALRDGEEYFFQAAQIALNPTVTFGIKKVTVIDQDDGAPNTLTFEDFMKFAERLRIRELTGKVAISTMHAASDRTSAEIWNTFYRRILLKDFKIGVSASTINKLLREANNTRFVIPVFTCQLAQTGNDHPNKMKGEKFLDVKLNGVRLLTVVDVESKTVSQYTRNGNPVENYPHLVSQFEKLIPHLPLSMVFDGEVTARTFQELMGQLQRKTNVDTSHHKVQLFDIVPLSDFLNGKSAIPQRTRHDTLMGLLPLMQQEGMDSVTILPKILVNLSTAEGLASMEQFKRDVLEAARQAGDENIFEGFMIKDPDAPYECRKGSHWLKWKPFITVDLTVVGLQKGDPEGKYSHTLGALECKGTDDGRYIETNVATGLSDKEREYFWNNPDKIIGYIVEVKGDELTQNENVKGTDVYSVRFPSFVCVRGSRAGEKI